MRRVPTNILWIGLGSALTLLVSGLVLGFGRDAGGKAPMHVNVPAGPSERPTQKAAATVRRVQRPRPTLGPEARRLTILGRPLFPLADGDLELVGRYVRADAVPVLSVVGDRVFWVGASKRNRVLVHEQGVGTRYLIRRGQRLSFTGVVTRNPRAAGRRWGVTAREGLRQLDRQSRHVEVFGPSIEFARAVPAR